MAQKSRKKAGERTRKQPTKAARSTAKTASKTAAKAATTPEGPWGSLTLAVLLAVLALRLVVVALEPFPVSAGEAEYWAYGQELDWGYYAQPPMVAWVIRAATDLAGDGLFALRMPAAIAHALIAWMIFLTGRRLWGGATGFWAAIGYTAAPGVALSAMIISPDPVVVVFWAAALYAMVCAAEAEGRIWWAVLGALIGAGMMADYNMAGFAAGALGYGLFSARERDWQAVAISTVAAMVAVSPNLYWNGAHGYSVFDHVAGEAGLAGDYFHVLDLLEFTAAQFALIGPVFMVAILLALRNRDAWVEDWGMRLVAWQTVPLLAAMLGLAFTTRAEANWAAPAFVGGSLLAARWLVSAGGVPALRAQVGVGVAASLALWSVAALYAGHPEALTRRLDPFVEMRISEPFCEFVLGMMGEEEVGVLLSDDRRRLSECMFLGELGWDEVAVWNPDGRIDNHHELLASLQPGDQREMLLVAQRGADRIAHQFAEAREIETIAIETHKDRSVRFSIWAVQGFKGH